MLRFMSRDMSKAYEKSSIMNIRNLIRPTIFGNKAATKSAANYISHFDNRDDETFSVTYKCLMLHIDLSSTKQSV